MRSRMLIPVIVVACAVVMPAAASAAAPDFKDRFDETLVEEDFCGTGEDVLVHAQGVAQGYDDGMVFRATFRNHTTFTYEGKTAYFDSAGRVIARSIDAPFDQPHTEVSDESGLRAKIRLPGQGVVTSDHGLLQYSITLVANPAYPATSDEPLIVSGEVVLKDAGGHPAFDSPLACEVLTDYFDIPFDPSMLD